MPRNGLYLADGSFMRFAETGERSLSAEIATRSRSIDFYSIGNMYLPNPDPVLKKQGKDIEVYTDLLVDDRVGGSMTNRINATLALNWEIDHGKSTKSRQARFIKEVFTALPLNRIIEQMIRNPRGFGYGPAEAVCAKRGDGLNAPVDIVFKPQRWFVFSQTNQLRFLSREHLLDGEELPARRFLCPTNEASYDNPYGLGLLSRCFWPVVFKRAGGWRFRMKFAEKYGAVWPVGKLPRSATQDQVDDFLEILENMVNDGVAVIPDDGSVDFLESGSKGATSDMFHSILADADSAISTVWLGHAGAGESVSGELGGKEIAIEVRKDLRDSDKTLVEETLNTLIDWICEENWGSAAGAPRFTLWEEEDVDKDQAERDVDLTTAMEKSGLKLSRGYYLRTYNLEEGDVEEKVEVTPPTPPLNKGGSPQGGGLFAEPRCPHCFTEGADLAGLTETKIAARLAQGADPAMTEWVDKLRGLVMEASSLEELRDAIAEAYPGMAAEALAGVMAEELTRAIVAGRIDAENGD